MAKQQLAIGPAEDIVPTSDPFYAQGWTHGYAQGLMAANGPPPPVSSFRKVLALGTLVGGLGGGAYLVLGAVPGKKAERWRTVLGLGVASGIILGAIVGAAQVLDGAPAALERRA